MKNDITHYTTPYSICHIYKKKQNKTVSEHTETDEMLIWAVLYCEVHWFVKISLPDAEQNVLLMCMNKFHSKHFAFFHANISCHLVFAKWL